MGLAVSNTMNEIAYAEHVGSVVEVSAAVDRSNVVVRILGRITDGILAVDDDLCSAKDDRIEFSNL